MQGGAESRQPRQAAAPAFLGKRSEGDLGDSATSTQKDQSWLWRQRKLEVAVSGLEPVVGPQRGGSGVSPPQAPVGVSAAGLAHVSLCPRLGAAPRAAPPPWGSCHLVPDWSPEKEGPSGVSTRPGRSGQGSGSAGCVPLPSILSPPWAYSVSWGLRTMLWRRAICRAPTWCQAGSGVQVG